MRYWKALAIAPLASMVLAGSAAAWQDENTEGMNPRVVPPAECVVDPRSADELVALLGLDAEGVQKPAEPEIAAPLGQNLDSEASVPIKEAVREVIACLNAGDIGRAAALMTDHGVLRNYWSLTETPELRAATQERLAAATPRPEPAQIRLVTTTDISVLPDGRAIAFVVINNPVAAQPGPETLLFYFANVDGEWKLDDLVDFSISRPIASTPTP
ncbi:MAG: hypothetical protein QM692_05975 [Thermomicrobiales bacterium]